MNMDKGGRWYE